MIFHKLNNEQEFNDWLNSMSDYLKDFILLFPEEDRERLDFSAKSLDYVEAWILKTYPDPDEMLVQAEAQKVNMLACYIGETFRRNLDGHWYVRFDNPKDGFFGLPILKCQSFVDCPLTSAIAASDRRTGAYLRAILQNHL